MVDSGGSACLDFAADLMIERVEGGEIVGAISIRTDDDGTLKIASNGRLPGGSIRELRQLRKGLVFFAQATQQDAVIEHNDRQFAQIKSKTSRVPRLSIRWWTVARFGLDQLLNRRRG